MHDCELCGQACACDGEDTYFDEQPDDCRHFDGDCAADESDEFPEQEILHAGERGEG